MVPCGFIKLSLRLGESTEIVAKVLEANEARGRRKYLRVHCGENTRLNVRTADGFIEGRILDISSVGMACVLKSGREMKAHTVLDSIQLQLKGSLCLLNGVVMGSRPVEGSREKAYVVLFDPKTSGVQKEKIRSYLQWALQASIEADLKAKGA
jgi:c-di-GMP-binding flagellar brake protein YcgR